jgi:hypothetical protein
LPRQVQQKSVYLCSPMVTKDRERV